jgi:hypothetical protein
MKTKTNIRAGEAMEMQRSPVSVVVVTTTTTTTTPNP